MSVYIPVKTLQSCINSFYLQDLFLISITVFQCYGTTSINTCYQNMLQPGTVSM